MLDESGQLLESSPREDPGQLGVVLEWVCGIVQSNSAATRLATRQPGGKPPNTPLASLTLLRDFPAALVCINKLVWFRHRCAKCLSIVTPRILAMQFHYQWFN